MKRWSLFLGPTWHWNYTDSQLSRIVSNMWSTIPLHYSPQSQTACCQYSSVVAGERHQCRSQKAWSGRGCGRHQPHPWTAHPRNTGRTRWRLESPLRVSLTKTNTHTQKKVTYNYWKLAWTNSSFNVALCPQRLRTIRGKEPRTATSTFTQLLSSAKWQLWQLNLTRDLECPVNCSGYIKMKQKIIKTTMSNFLFTTHTFCLYVSLKRIGEE